MSDEIKTGKGPAKDAAMAVGPFAAADYTAGKQQQIGQVLNDGCNTAQSPNPSRGRNHGRGSHAAAAPGHAHGGAIAKAGGKVVVAKVAAVGCGGLALLIHDAAPFLAAGAAAVAIYYLFRWIGSED